MMRQQSRRPAWLLVIAGLFFCGVIVGATSFENKTGGNEANNPRLFSPRMDYDEWTPLGRGDPLKNDPTFDYVPPILDRVQYWMDSHTTEASSKSDILVLGVTAKKTSPKIPEQFLKFVNGPKFMRNQEAQQAGSYVTDFTGSRGAEPPKVIRKTAFRNGIKDYRNQDRIEAIPASYYPSSFYNQNPKPETMMLPPPVIRGPDGGRPLQAYDTPTNNHLYLDQHRFNTQTEASRLPMKHQIYDHPQNTFSLPDAHLSVKPPRKHYTQVTADRQKLTTKEPSAYHRENFQSYSAASPEPQATQYKYETTTPSVSSVKSNLIYQSSQTISGGWFAKTRQPTQTPQVEHLDSVTWESSAPSNIREHIYEEDVHQASGSSHHEVVLGPNSNIIVEGDSSDKEEIVIGQQEVVPPSEPSSSGAGEEETDHEEVPTAPGSDSQNMYIVLANSSPPSGFTNLQSKKETTVTVVMPEKLVDNDVTTTTVAQEEEQTTLPPSEPHFTAEEGQLEDQPMHPSFGTIPNHQESHFMSEPPAQTHHSPTQMSMTFQQPPTRLAPHRDAFMEASSQRLPHHQPSHARPVHVMSHFNPHPGLSMGMGFRETPSPAPMSPPPYSSMPMSEIKPNMRFPPMQPYKTMTIDQPSVNNMHNQPPRFYQQHFQPPPTTTTHGVTQSAAPSSMASIPISPINGMNGMRDSITRNEAHTKPHRVNDTTDKTTSAPRTPQPSAPPRTTSELSSSVFTTTTAVPTTTAPTLTTDPIFSHYKQPSNPLRGPMYLIIQGHSKVKTYKPWIDKHGNQVETEELPENTTKKQISPFERFVKENTKKIAEAERLKETKRTTTERPREHIGQDSLLSFVDSGLGAFPLPSARPDPNDKSPIH